MFLGEYEHSLDAKGRVIVPARFREQLDEGAVITKALEGCLAVWPAEEFEQVAQRAREAAKRGTKERQAARAFFAGAAEVTMDRQGRVAVPPKLREFAGLEREVVVSGQYDRVEIWDAQRFASVDREGDASILAAEDISDFGM